MVEGPGVVDLEIVQHGEDLSEFKYCLVVSDAVEDVEDEEDQDEDADDIPY